MAFGQQPQGNSAQNNGFNNQYQYNQQYNQYNAQPQYAYAPNGTAAVNVQAPIPTSRPNAVPSTAHTRT